MFRKSLLFTAMLVCLCISVPSSVSAQYQFGKNRVQYRKLNWQYYKSPHFGIRHYFDLKDPMQANNMKKLVALLENQYSFYSSTEVFDFEISELLPVVVFDTHGDVEGNPLADPFLPEGVGAFVDWARVRMVIKEDFEPQLFERIVAHELVHQFQMKIAKRSVVGNMLGMRNLPNGFIEGGAEYMAGVRLPHTRGDIRDDQMRMMGSDVHTMPSWELLMADGVNGYVAWKMVYDFLDAKFGPGMGIKFHVRGMKTKGDLGSLLYDLSRGKLGNPNINSNIFNQEFFDYHTGLYEVDRVNIPKPYQNTVHFKGRNITPNEHPYPMLSPVLSPDGKRIACFTIQKYGVALVVFPIPDEAPVYKENDTARKKKEALNQYKKVVINLTPNLPPIPYEYLVNPLETWPKNGSHLDWSRDNRIAFFARTGRDHMLYIIDPEKKGKILYRKSLDVDQAFSPKFSPDGTRIYFSAAQHGIFDLYVIELNTDKVTNLTDDERYDTGPAVSLDGKKVVYVGNDGDFNHLFMLDLVDGSKKQMTFGRYNDISPSWSDNGNTIVFVSDEWNKVFNPYTLDVATNARSQRFSLFGGVETPIFARNSDDTIYYTVFRNNDTFHGQVYRNHEIFEAKLKSPITTETVVDKHESNIYSFNSDRFFEFELDPNQVNKPRKPPEDWLFEGSDIQVGGSRFYGLYSSSFFYFHNLMETKHHMLQLATYGSYFKVFGYTYLDQSNRTSRALNVYYNTYPLAYRYWDNTEQRPKGSELINFAYWREGGGSVSLLYPFSKWTRAEFSSGFRDIKFELDGLTPEIFETYKDYFSPLDQQLYPVMVKASGPSLVTGAALVRDTVIGTSDGPFHGNAFRAEVSLAPPVGNKLKGYVTGSVEGRVYKHVPGTTGIVLALRGEAKATTRASGEIIVAGGSDRFRGRKWGTIIGNELLYGSAELRFPFMDGIVFPGGIGIGPFRGLFFVDAGIAKFRGEKFRAQKVSTYGAGIEFKPFQLVWAKQPNGKFVPSFYYTYGW